MGVPKRRVSHARQGERRSHLAIELPKLAGGGSMSLADYKVPKHVEIQAQLPREDSGKIFKRRLRDPYWVRAGRRI